MKQKGFLLIEVLMGLFLLGLITVTCLPILNTTSNNLGLIKGKMDMVFIAESTMEQIKAFDPTRTRENEYLYGMQLVELMQILKDQDPAVIVLPLNISDNNYKYICNIYKENHNENLWKIRVKVLPFEEERRISDVEIEAFVPSPQKEKMVQQQ